MPHPQEGEFARSTAVGIPADEQHGGGDDGDGADDKKLARLNIISHLLSQVPYKPLPHRDIKLPKRQQRDGYVQPDLPVRHIATPF